ncbi:hypothetical protein B6N60_02750 [Richelia sinica FACHB-800]|uniref:Uncharacterized protein n=1 Tax=Richelia sinica FACHB-800 TaxID=1357546 RepID=A0A975T9P3_9NOST|nr:hypothetical protein B6N60_02750 [Richelia sinica FACHB-800]
MSQIAGGVTLIGVGFLHSLVRVGRVGEVEVWLNSWDVLSNTNSLKASYR